MGLRREAKLIPFADLTFKASSLVLVSLVADPSAADPSAALCSVCCAESGRLLMVAFRPLVTKNAQTQIRKIERSLLSLLLFFMPLSNSLQPTPGSTYGHTLPGLPETLFALFLPIVK